MVEVIIDAREYAIRQLAQLLAMVLGRHLEVGMGGEVPQIGHETIVVTVLLVVTTIPIVTTNLMVGAYLVWALVLFYSVAKY
jgi:hypothetical protein